MSMGLWECGSIGQYGERLAAGFPNQTTECPLTFGREIDRSLPVVIWPCPLTNQQFQQFRCLYR